ncbi:methionine gamma-lyase family protein [Hazenella sp. IB182357]|uniref:Methionine gamma-lyase family protein n=1 Tax=Polycladospora coralii TaxID=2771432 RepID=A0A926RXW8_9BACL|nr:methionine gamma-lyase family protein [Polycladospora coralii]MBD1372931.1 methionine gamma-lyase family protein [Polycladospora coralii]
MIERVEQKIDPMIRRIEKEVDQHQWRVLTSFRKHRVSEQHLQASTGYGYDDMGRETLEQIFAELMGAEMAIVRPHITSGTHAITSCLFGILRPGDAFIYLTGEPYDTLEQVIGKGKDGSGSLADFDITYQAISLTDHQEVDFLALEKAISQRTRLIAIQRSRGYADRPSFSIERIQAMIKKIRQIRSDLIIFVDNCYGEFVEQIEPTHVGADLIAGSLIKNPGGGLAKSGGYIAGKMKYVKQAASRLVAPGIGVEGGATHGYLRDYFQGLFLAPHVVGEARKGAVFTAAMLDLLGFKTSPSWDEQRTDIIQQVHLGEPELLIAFCQGIQAASPVDAHISPVPAAMPGYLDPVIMAAGTFVQGASIELSADGPLRPPYTVFLQGGLTFSHIKAAIALSLDQMMATGKI